MRDPRPVMASRAAMDWCLKGHCGSTSVACTDLESDIQAANRLTKEYPGRITLLRYYILPNKANTVACHNFCHKNTNTVSLKYTYYMYY